MSVSMNKKQMSISVKPVLKNRNYSVALFGAETNELFKSPHLTLSKYINTKNKKLKNISITSDAYLQSNKQEIPDIKRIIDVNEVMEDGYLLLRGRENKKIFLNIIYHLGWFDKLQELDDSLYIPSQLLFITKDAPLTQSRSYRVWP